MAELAGFGLQPLRFSAYNHDVARSHQLPVDVILKEPEVVPPRSSGRGEGHGPAGPSVGPLHGEHVLVGPCHLVHPYGGGGLCTPEGDGYRLAGKSPSGYDLYRLQGIAKAGIRGFELLPHQ